MASKSSSQPYFDKFAHNIVSIRSADVHKTSAAALPKFNGQFIKDYFIDATQAQIEFRLRHWRLDWLLLAWNSDSKT